MPARRASNCALAAMSARPVVTCRQDAITVSPADAYHGGWFGVPWNQGGPIMKALVTLVAATVLSTAALAQTETASPPAPATPPSTASPQSGSIFDTLDADHD